MPISTQEILGSAAPIRGTRLSGDGPPGRLPLTEEMLLHEPSGNLFGLTQNAGMGWDPDEVNRPATLILSTLGGLRAEDGTPIALGYHTGHWELGLLVREAAANAARSGGAALCRLRQRPVRWPLAGHPRHARLAGLPQRRGHRHAPADPLAAHPPRRASASPLAIKACPR